MYRNSRHYYEVAGVSAEDVIDGMNMLHREGAAIKYLFRCNNIAPKGDIVEDLKKCKHYLSRCLKYDYIPVRDYTASYWLDRIEPAVFDQNIYNAIYEIILAVGGVGEKYLDRIETAIEFIDDAINKY